jgi:hypothetical protein
MIGEPSRFVQPTGWQAESVRIKQEHQAKSK